MALIFLLLQIYYSRDGCYNRYLGSTYPTAERRRTSKRQYTTYLDGTVSFTPQYDSLIITSHAHSVKDVIRRVPRTTCATLLCEFSQCTYLSTNQSFGYWFVDRRHQARKTCLNYPPLTAGSEGNFVLLAVE
ncbi:hypothetical protein CPAR01_11638 [Colletotrichum paranaense]|uniref:Secreted protein n=1 Tax=Colletotrichum paranaense TaxID=1914294 RepID=A0ABQ9SC66_9PEZI|nr:uncharacterized protein CPAR01_11638 [Colletotrichum paranaense]KAK1531989.1 hypothetical protein CPAR01_11638 [Colletotrichum paranaense]